MSTRKYLHVNSYDDYLKLGNNAYFSVRLAQAIKPTRIKLLSFSSANIVNNLGFESPFFPNGLFLFPLDESSAGGTALIQLAFPTGIYNLQTWCVALQAAMNANTTVGAVYTVTPNYVTHKYTITSTMSFSIPWLDVANLVTPPRVQFPWLIGFTGFINADYVVNNALIFNYPSSLVGGVNTVVTPYCVNFQEVTPLFINIVEFPSSTLTSSPPSLVNFVIFNRGVNGSAITFDANSNYEQYLTLTHKQINTITVQILGVSGTVLNWGNCAVNLLFEYYEDLEGPNQFNLNDPRLFNN